MRFNKRFNRNRQIGNREEESLEGYAWKEQIQRGVGSPAIQISVHKAAESFISSIYTSGKSFSSADDAQYFLFYQASAV